MSSAADTHTQSKAGTLYVVATPIGHLSDLSPRAAQILNDVDCIAAEDTRHSQRLKKQTIINTPFMSYHQHNEAKMGPRLLQRLQQGDSIALISDAGTPLISDPGYDLVARALAAGITVSPVPGPCAAIAALSVSGLATDRFAFEGFLPPKSAARRTALRELQYETRTMVFYEAPHRLLRCLEDMAAIWGETRHVAAMSELTKCHEKICAGTLHDVGTQLSAGDAPKGEWVLVAAGCDRSSLSAQGGDQQGQLHACEQALTLLLAEVSLKKAVSIASKLYHMPKNKVYTMALSLQKAAEKP